MNVGWLTTRPPYPANAGGKIAVYWRLRAMAELGHRIDLVGAISGESPNVIAEAASHLDLSCRTVEFVPAVSRAQAILGVTRGLPWGAARRLLDDDTVKRLCARLSDIDVLLVDQSGMVPAARQLMDVWGSAAPPMVVFQFADASSSLRLTADRSAPLRKAQLLVEAAAYRRLDRSIIEDPRVAHIGFVSSTELERSVAESGLATERASFHPLPFPLDDDGAIRTTRATPSTALFVASFDDPGNRLAASWLVNEILPRLDRADTTLVIAGRKAATLPFEPIDGLEILSDVPDLDSLFDSASVALVPVHGGGGVRVKLLEAIARRLPVVTTTLGVEGTTFTAEHVSIADSPEGFAAAVGSLVADPGPARIRAEAAHRVLARTHDPDVVGRRLADTLECVVASSRR